MSRLALSLLSIILFLSCASTSEKEAGAAGERPAQPGTNGAQERKPEDAAEKAAEKAQKRATLERQQALEQQKLEKARLDATNQELASQGTLHKAEAELRIATAKRQHFEQTQSPHRVAQAQLGLQQANDSFADAKEEMEQLELMYAEQDLADKTKEIVIRRGKRRLEMAERRLALQQKELENLENFELPQELAKLTLEVEEKTREVDRARRGLESSKLEREIAVRAIENEIRRIEGELKNLASP